MRAPLKRTLLFAALTVLVVSGCGDSTAPPPPPGVQPEIVNITDSFEYQVQSVTNYTRSTAYTWRNTGTTAAVDHSTVTDDGTGTLVVLDADGTQVYTGPLADSGSTETLVGVAGDWTVRITYSSFSGTVNFRVQKA